MNIVFQSVDVKISFNEIKFDSVNVVHVIFLLLEKKLNDQVIREALHVCLPFSLIFLYIGNSLTPPTLPFFLIPFD